MKVCFIAAGPIEWGSSRMRAWWVAEEMGVQCVQYGKSIPESDVYIWQKNVSLDFVNNTQDKQHYWDICDPFWWFNPQETAAIGSYMEGVVFSSNALMVDFMEFAEPQARLYTIPDRLNLPHFSKKKKHEKTAVIRFLWFGVAVNRQALYAAITNLERLKANGYNVELTIFDDRPDIPFSGVSFPVYHTRWNLSQENEIIAGHDIALLPPYPGPWGKVKSNNKTLTANACGLPVSGGQDYYSLVELVENHELRQLEADAGFMTVKNHYTIDNSAKEWEAILC